MVDHPGRLLAGASFSQIIAEIKRTPSDIQGTLVEP